jgi:hypothetical protein
MENDSNLEIILIPFIEILKSASQEDVDFFMHIARVNPHSILLWIEKIKSQEDFDQKIADWKKRGFKYPKSTNP